MQLVTPCSFNPANPGPHLGGGNNKSFEFTIIVRFQQAGKTTRNVLYITHTYIRSTYFYAHIEKNETSE